MAKDPAFLFYSKDFYEGTRMMLPEERACYIDLIIYQHQNGIIPNDTKRLVMYCSGCSEQTIISVLNQKFKQMVNGWLNERLDEEISKRSTSKPKKAASACFAGLISRSNLNKKDKEKIKKMFVMDDFIKENDEVIKDETLIKSRVREWFKELVNQMVNNKANVNVNAIENENENENKDENKDENEKLNFQEIKKIFNDLASNCEIPTIREITESRRRAFRLLHKDYSLDEIGEVFQKAHDSSFLNGKNDRGFVCTFDWIMQKKNFLKILENNFKNKTNGFTEAKQTGVSDSFRRKTAERLGVVQPQ
ncbi:DUF1376 domain-containing protein [Aquimarina hainanensis]|uniref:DUF1376 domain-containing protein n=1 Tax=Aquimarina hainanensis TaxID=1578017 RepID=A0ABW5N9G1_9FLAO